MLLETTCRSSTANELCHPHRRAPRGLRKLWTANFDNWGIRERFTQYVPPCFGATRETGALRDEWFQTVYSRRMLSEATALRSAWRETSNRTVVAFACLRELCTNPSDSCAATGTARRHGT